MALYYIDEELIGIRSTLRNELVLINRKIVSENDIYERESLNRTFCRIYISMIEGVLNYSKHYLIEEFEKGNITISEEELFILKGKSYNLDSSGKVTSTHIRFPIKKKFKFINKLFSKLYKKEEIYNKYISLAEFQMLLKSIDIRNRITHPKKSIDLEVTDEEFSIIYKAYKWYEEFHRDLFENNFYTEKASS